MKSFQTVSETPHKPSLRLGLLINPYAGVGGPLALKGSDSLPAAVRNNLHAQVASSDAPAQQRVAQFLQALATEPLSLQWVSVDGPLGGAVLAQAGLRFEAVSVAVEQPSTAADTQALACAIAAAGVDLLIFAGGDGTARDICDAIGMRLPVLGLPAGVKMHSGVFAINPQAAATVVADLQQGRWVALDTAEVRDIDEAALQTGRVIAKHFGEMRVPIASNQLQQVKCSGLEVEALVVAEIAADVTESMPSGQLYALGPGTTVAAVAAALGVANTLLGFDLVRDGALVLADATADDLWQHAQRESLRVIITPTGGQGSLIGRGNQQLTATLLQKIGRDALQVLATPAKLKALSGRPLRLDTHNAELDRAWSGLWPITTGYQQAALYSVSG